MKSMVNSIKNSLMSQKSKNMVASEAKEPEETMGINGMNESIELTVANIKEANIPDPSVVSEFN